MNTFVSSAALVLGFSLTAASFGATTERKDALLPPDVYTAPVPARYLDENRMFLCGPAITVSRGGRLWVTFKTGDIWEDEDNCAVVVTSGDGAETPRHHRDVGRSKVWRLKR